MFLNSKFYPWGNLSNSLVQDSLGQKFCKNLFAAIAAHPLLKKMKHKEFKHEWQPALNLSFLLQKN